jgi:hypothetical protein
VNLSHLVQNTLLNFVLNTTFHMLVCKIILHTKEQKMIVIRRNFMQFSILVRI